MLQIVTAISSISLENIMQTHRKNVIMSCTNLSKRKYNFLEILLFSYTIHKTILYTTNNLIV